MKKYAETRKFRARQGKKVEKEISMKELVSGTRKCAPPQTYTL